MPGARNKFGAPCSNLSSFGRKCAVEESSLCHCCDFSAIPQWFGARGIVPPCPPPYASGRGVTRWDGARGKKQVWLPHVRTWGLSEANILHWSTYDIVRTFRRHAVIRRPGNCAPCPRRYARDYCAQRRASTKPWYTALTKGIRQTLGFRDGEFFNLPEFLRHFEENE